MAKILCWIQHIKKNRNRKYGKKDGKALYILMNNAVYGKTMENLRNRVDIKLVSNKKDCLKWTSKSSYMLHKIIYNELLAIWENDVSITLKNPPYNGMCILELSKVLTYKFLYDYIKKNMATTRDYYSQTLIV